MSCLVIFLLSIFRNIGRTISARMSDTTSISFFARIQAAFQTYLRPGMWIPLIRSAHSHEENWVMPSRSSRANMQDIMRGLMTVIQEERGRSFWLVKKANPEFIQVQVFTRLEWMDVIEFKIKDSSVQVRAFSTGFLPLCIPFACLINLFFVWLPFWDFGINKKRIQHILEAMDIGIQRS